MNKAAAGKIRPGHHGFSVSDRIFHAPAPEPAVEYVIGIAGNQPDGNLAGGVIKACSQKGVSCKHIYQFTILWIAFNAANFFPVYPRVSVPYAFFRIWRYHYPGILPFLLQLVSPSERIIFCPIVPHFFVTFNAGIIRVKVF